MSNSECCDRVRRVIAEAAAVSLDEVTTDSTLGSLGLDSLETAQLVMDIEDAWNLEIADAEFNRLTTVGELVQWMTAQTA